MSSSAGAAERRREKPIPLLLGGYAALAETAWMGVAQALVIGEARDLYTRLDSQPGSENASAVRAHTDRAVCE